MNPSIEINIEELVLHGFSPRQARGIGQAIESELGRLIREQGLPATFSGEIDLDSLQAGAFQMEPGSSARQTGRQIANSLYAGFSRSANSLKGATELSRPPGLKPDKADFSRPQKPVIPGSISSTPSPPQ